MTTKKVLILEDDFFLIKVMQKKFEKSGHQVKILTNGTKAVDAAIDFKPDAILVDLIMPETDGFVAIERLKREPQTTRIPIIVASNLNTDEDIAKTQKLGVVKYFVKSNVDLNEVISYINAL